MRRGWEVNSSAAAAGPAQTPAALSWLRAAASGLASAAAETWQTQPTHQGVTQRPVLHPLAPCPSPSPGSALASPWHGAHGTTREGVYFSLGACGCPWVRCALPMMEKVTWEPFLGGCSPWHGQAWWGMAGYSVPVPAGHCRSMVVPCEECPCPTTSVPAPRVASLPHNGCPCPTRGGSASLVQARAAIPAMSGYSQGTSRATSGAACGVRSPLAHVATLAQQLWGLAFPCLLGPV